MSEGEILETLRGLARDELRLTQAIDPGADLVADLGLDSMTATTLIVAVEDRFRICLPDALLADVRSVSDLVAVIARRLAC
jgi:acyl carrier protein